MTLSERILELHRLPLFQDMPVDELATVAAATVERTFAPGELVHPAGRPMTRLHLVLAGRLLSAAGEALPEIVGVASLLFDIPPAADVCADAETGATCLLLEKGHFYTTAYEGTGVAARLLTYATPALDQGQARR